MSAGVFLTPRVSATNAPLQGKTAAFGTAGVNIAAKQGRLYKVRAVNSGATAYFLQIHDKATAPTAGGVPIWEVRLPANGDGAEDFGLAGLYFANGLGLAISTTAGTLTFAAATDAVAYVTYAS